MNDTELDRLLNTWEAPLPPPTVRQGLRAKFPRLERRPFTRPLRWVLAIALATATLAIAMDQIGANPWDFRMQRTLEHLRHVLQNMNESLEPRIASNIVKQIQQSAPKVYVDGQLVAPLEYGAAATMNVNVPGDAVYSVVSYPMPSLRADGQPTGWVKAGRIHGNAIEFEAGGKQVRIVCNQPIWNVDRPVYVMRRQ